MTHRFEVTHTDVVGVRSVSYRGNDKNQAVQAQATFQEGRTVLRDLEDERRKFNFGTPASRIELMAFDAIERADVAYFL